MSNFNQFSSTQAGEVSQQPALSCIPVTGGVTFPAFISKSIVMCSSLHHAVQYNVI